MNSLKTLFFPATVIHSIRQYPVFLLFPQITVLAPAERPEPVSAQESTDTFINSGFCQVDTPCPLGVNLTRFKQLVKDIQNRKDDYAAQLSSLTLASMSAPPGTGEESERDIIHEFLTPKDLKVEEETEKREAKLWQARLVLAIGEILDSEEEEIARNLAMVEDETSGLFNSLHGEEEELEDTPFGELSQLTSKLSAAHGGNMRKRLNAWKTIYAESGNQDAEIFITDSGDVVDALIEAYEKTNSGMVVQLQELEIPGLIGWGEEEAVAAVKLFKEESSELLNELQDILKRLQQVKDQQESVPAFKAKWKEQLEASFPESKWGRLPVTINVFPGAGVNTLLGLTEEKAQKNGVVLSLG